MKNLSIIVVFLTVCCVNMHNQPEKHSLDNLSIKELAKFDLYYLNYSSSVYSCIEKDTLRYISVDIDVMSSPKDSLRFFGIYKDSVCPELEWSNNFHLINTLVYNNQKQLIYIGASEIHFDSIQGLLPHGYRDIFVDTLKRNQSILTPWLLKLLN